MALTGSGKFTGSVSGGCVEGAVLDASSEVLRTGKAQLLEFGVADEKAWEVGLACGGTIEIFLQPLNVELIYAIDKARQEPNASVTIVRGDVERIGRQLLFCSSGNTVGSLGDGIDELAIQAARRALDTGSPQRVDLALPTETTSTAIEEQVQRVNPGLPAMEDKSMFWNEIFIDVTLPPPTLVIVGGVHISVALTNIAKTLGYRTVVVDPRRAFGSDERFPNIDQLILSWPDQALKQIGINSSTAVAVLTHDPKLDDPALQVALTSPAFYVGALGSKATNIRRRDRLIRLGLGSEALDRLKAPIGLDLGGRTPEEIALAVMAQIVASSHRLPGC